MNIILRIIQERKKEKKKDNKGIREIKKFIWELYIKENIIIKMNKMILVIFGEYKYEWDVWVSSYSFFI